METTTTTITPKKFKKVRTGVYRSTSSKTKVDANRLRQIIERELPMRPQRREPDSSSTK